MMMSYDLMSPLPKRVFVTLCAVMFEKLRRRAAMKLSKLFGFCLNETAMETFDNMGWLRSNKGEKKIKGAFETKRHKR